MSQTKSKCSTKIETFHSLMSISGGCVCDRTAKPLVTGSSTANIYSQRDCVRCVHWRGKNFLSTRWTMKNCSLFLESIAWSTSDYIKNVLLPWGRQVVSLDTRHSLVWWLLKKVILFTIKKTIQDNSKLWIKTKPFSLGKTTCITWHAPLFLRHLK